MFIDKLQTWTLKRLSRMSHSEVEQSIKTLNNFFHNKPKNIDFLESICTFIIKFEHERKYKPKLLSISDIKSFVTYLTDTIKNLNSEEYSRISTVTIMKSLEVFVLMQNHFKIELLIIDKISEILIKHTYNTSHDADSFLKTMSHLSNLNYTPSSELLDKLIEIYTTQKFDQANDSNFSYSYQPIVGSNKIQMVKVLAKMEQKVANSRHQPFLDQYEELYDREMSDIIKSCDFSQQEVHSLSDSLIRAYYRDDVYIQKITEYKVNALVSTLSQLQADIEHIEEKQTNHQFKKTKVAQIYQQVFRELLFVCKLCNFFNTLPDDRLTDCLLDAINIFSKSDQHYDFDTNFSVKFLVFQRFLCLFSNSDEDIIKNSLIQMINYTLSKNKHHLSLEQFHNINTIMWCEPDIVEPEIRNQIQNIASKQPLSTIVSKFQQDVVSLLNESKILKYELRLDDTDHLIEKDVVIKSITLINSKSKTPPTTIPCHIILEINGVWHYPRNSEEILGKDVLKINACQKLYGENENYSFLSIPYYDWNILEDSQKQDYLTSLVLNSIGLELGAP